MELYNDTDLNTFKNHIHDVIEKITDIVNNDYAPTKTERIAVQKVILEFARDKKRKMYGGYALHLAIKEKKIGVSFYKEEELYMKDLDLYSPEPLKDLVELCDILAEKGFTHIYAREATHAESYTLEVNKQPYCDFSYVPRNVYNKIPFITVDGLTVTYPYFMAIDYLKIFSDPILAASFRWEKSFERFYMLQKYYPIKPSKKTLNIEDKLPKNIFDILYKFSENNKTIALTGFQAYNMYFEVSKIERPYIKKLNIPYFEFVSTDYEQDVKKILELLENVLDKTKIKINEYYPFFTFNNYHTEVIYDGVVIAKVYNVLHNLCFPYVVHKHVNYYSFHLNLRTCLINAIYERVNENRENEQMFYDMASHLIQMRKYYLDGSDNTMFSDTVFKDFNHKCMGFTQSDKLERDDMFRKHKRVAFKYTPNETTIDVSKWVFSNNSGNKINNPKNYKIIFNENDIHDTTIKNVIEE